MQQSALCSVEWTDILWPEAVNERRKLNGPWKLNVLLTASSGDVDLGASHNASRRPICLILNTDGRVDKPLHFSSALDYSRTAIMSLKRKAADAATSSAKKAKGDGSITSFVSLDISIQMRGTD